MDVPAVGEGLSLRLARGERPSNIFRLPTETGPVAPTTNIPEPDPVPPVPPTLEEPAPTPEPTAEPLPHADDTSRPRQRHFAEHVLLVEPDESTGVGIRIHTPTQVVHARHIYQKTRDFATSIYILALLAFGVRWAVFFSFLFAGSARGAEFSLLLGLTEITAALITMIRTWRGSMRLLLAIGNWCLLASVAEFGIAISGCVTNWMNLERNWARWVAVTFSFVHALLIMQLGISLINVLHAKMNNSYQSSKISRATRLAHGDPLPPGFVENAKRTQ